MTSVDSPSAYAASVVLAAGKGSRMLGFEGNKTLLPLLPETSIYSGQRPLLIEVLENLPAGPKGIVVHHVADAVRALTGHLGVVYCEQPVTNGTGGALLAAGPFIESADCDWVIITMGDVPLIRPDTYRKLLDGLSENHLMVLAFEAADQAQYGMLETAGDRVLRITEWKYWRDYPVARREQLRWCNAGVYAARRASLVYHLQLLAQRPHQVRKQRGDEWVTINEYFLTDLVELMRGAGQGVGLVLAEEEEVMGVDTPEALRRAQTIYAQRCAGQEAAKPAE